MAKPRIKTETEEHDPLPVADVLEKDEPESETRWVVGHWNGLEQYRCAFCPWDTLDGLEAMTDHWLTHAPALVIEAPMILRVDRFGNPAR